MNGVYFEILLVWLYKPQASKYYKNLQEYTHKNNRPLGTENINRRQNNQRLLLYTAVALPSQLICYKPFTRFHKL
jgi:hypothetical protein